jgi:hypothetical protein
LANICSNAIMPNAFPGKFLKAYTNKY